MVSVTRARGWGALGEMRRHPLEALAEGRVEGVEGLRGTRQRRQRKKHGGVEGGGGSALLVICLSARRSLAPCTLRARCFR